MSNWARLQGRAPDLPLELQLPSGETLVLVRWLRVLPEQRYVALADWEERRVVVKLFVGAKAEKHCQREVGGVQLLLARAIDTPNLLSFGFEPECGGWAMLEYLDGSQSLAEHWNACVDEVMLSENQHQVLQKALVGLARLHAQGLWQEDTHLDNFLLKQGVLYTIDGGGIVQQKDGVLTDAQALANLAVFFAQLPVTTYAHLAELLQDYQSVRPDTELPLARLRVEIEKVREWRVKDYLKKTARDCTLFHANKDTNGVTVIQRSCMDEVKALIDQPDVFIAQGHIYKTGGAATVALVEHQQKNWIIKRYNIKSFSHWLSRCWRPTRAWHSWQAAHRLQILGIPVMNAVAVKEQRKLGLRYTAWLVCEQSGTQDLVERFAPYVENGNVPETDLRQLSELLNSLIREKISHGDLKGHNILWHNDQPLLIDLDAVRAHRCLKSFKRAFKRDRARLLRNWPSDSPLYKKLDHHLPRADASESN